MTVLVVVGLVALAVTVVAGLVDWLDELLELGETDCSAASVSPSSRTGAGEAERGRLLSGSVSDGRAGSNPALSVATRSRGSKRGVAPAPHLPEGMQAHGESRESGDAPVAEVPDLTPSQEVDPEPPTDPRRVPDRAHPRLGVHRSPWRQ